MADEARIDVEIGSSGAVSGATAVKRAVDDIKTSAFGLNITMAAVANNIQTAVMLITKAWESAKLGAKFEETFGRLNHQMGGFRSNAQSMISDLQLISHGTLGMSDAATMASRALASGLDPNQVITFTKAAMLLKDATGTELPQAFDRMVVAATGGQGKLLRQIGIYVDMDQEIRKLAVSTGRTTERITEQEKVMLMQAAIAGKVAAAARTLTDEVVSGADKLQAVEKAWEDMWLNINRASNTAVQSMLKGLGAVILDLQKIPGKYLPFYRGLTDSRTGPPPTEFESVSPRTYGNGTKTGETVLSEPSSMQRDRIQTSAEINNKIRQGTEQRFLATLQAEQEMLDKEVTMQLRTANEIVTRRGELEIQGLAKHAEFLSQARVADQASYVAQKKIIGDSIQENIALEKAHTNFQTENAVAIAATIQAIGIQSDKNQMDRAVALRESFKTTGDDMVTKYKEDFAAMEAVRKQDIDDLEAYYQGEVEMGISRYASDAEMAVKERVLLRDQVAFKLQLKREEIDRMIFLRNAGDIEGAMDIARRSPTQMKTTALEAVVESSAGKDIRMAERANDDFFAGWSRGMQKYVNDRDTALGMSADMARRVAQGMEQGFQKFFFDGMEGKFNSFKDILSGVLDFTKQIVSQMMAQMVTVGIIKPGVNALMGLAGSLFGGGGAAASLSSNYASTDFFSKKGFASGGSFMVGGSGGTDTTPVSFMATPGEHVSITTPGQRGRGASVSVPIDIQIINQVSGAKVETQRQTGSDGKTQIRILIRQEMKSAFADGTMDQSLQRFGSMPQPRGR